MPLGSTNSILLLMHKVIGCILCLEVHSLQVVTTWWDRCEILDKDRCFDWMKTHSGRTYKVHHQLHTVMAEKVASVMELLKGEDTKKQRTRVI